MTQHLIDNHCTCNLCRNKKQILEGQKFEPKSEGRNCLLEFLNYLPRNFPIMIVPTSFTNQKLHYQNRYKNRLVHQSFSKATENFPLATHLILYYQNEAIIVFKYDILKHHQHFVYLQSYQTHPPISYKYARNSEKLFDELLKQKLEIHLKQMVQDQFYTVSEKQKESLKWIHSEYGDQIYAAYMTNLYCSFINYLWNNKIEKGIFEWIVEGIDEIRLVNVKDLIIKVSEKNVSFQQEYEQKIIEKLNVQSTQINLIDPKKSKLESNRRVLNFKQKMNQIYNKEKSKLLQQTQKERIIETKTLSDDVGRFFLPDLKNYSSLRQVLNNEEIFRKVVLGSKRNKTIKSKSRSKQKIKIKGPGNNSFRIKTQH